MRGARGLDGRRSGCVGSWCVGCWGSLRGAVVESWGAGLLLRGGLVGVVERAVARGGCSVVWPGFQSVRTLMSSVG